MNGYDSQSIGESTVKNTLLYCGIGFVLSVCCLVSHAWSADKDSDTPTLTFFGWSDQHVATDGNADHLLPAIDAMNALPGTPYPNSIGGTVSEPAFVFGCGDITEWPTHAAKTAYEQLLNERLKFPAYDLIGNHDEGGQMPSETMKNWLIERHGALSYVFSKGGVSFIVLFSKYDESLANPAQPLSEEALDFVRTRLSCFPKKVPVVIATHLCFDAMTNRDALCEAIGDANVIAILGGHYHKAQIDRYHNRWFIQLPSPAPGSPSEFMVLRITPDRLVAIPYDYQKKQWCSDVKKQVNVPW